METQTTINQESLEAKAVRLSAQIGVAAIFAKSFFDSTQQYLSNMQHFSDFLVTNSGLDNYQYLAFGAPSLKLAVFALLGYASVKGTGLLMNQVNQVFRI